MLPKQVVADRAETEQLRFNTVPLFTTSKAEKHMGRLVFDFSNNGPNHLENKCLLSTKVGAISPPQLGDICKLIENAHGLYPESVGILQAIRRDIEGAFHHLRYSMESSLLCAAEITIDGIEYVVLSCVAVMGDQTVNYAFNLVSVAIKETLATYISDLIGSALQLSTVATDDIIAVGPPQLIDAVHDKIGLLVGDGRQPGLCSTLSAIAPAKDLRGQRIVILGWLFDIPGKMVWPNNLTFAKLVYCLFVFPGADPKPGQPITVRHLQTMGAHVMRASNVIVSLLSFSRGFLANTRGKSNPKAIVFLTRRSCYDIEMWRLLLTMAFTDIEM